MAILALVCSPKHDVKAIRNWLTESLLISYLGKETARVLLLHNAKVYIACRSPERAAAAVEDLKKITGKTDQDIAVLKVDLADLHSVKSGVADFLQYVLALLYSMKIL